MQLHDPFVKNLNALKQQDNLRVLPSDTTDYLLDLSTNDYLGLNTNKKMYQEFMIEFERERYAFSASSSRLLLKNAQQHLQLEQLLARSYGAEACLLFNSGYHCNVGVIPAIAKKRDLIIADKFVHASCIDGAKLSDATLIRYKHLDYEHLEQLLLRYRIAYENVFIISESVFSMDGDVANLEQLVALKNSYNCFLYIDEAHALGVRGAKGLGCVEEMGLLNQVDFIVGAFGKALASVGGFIVCKAVFKSFFVNHARSFMFSTALPPVNIAWTHFVFKQLADFNDQRLFLKNTSRQFSNLLAVSAQSNIVPYVVGTNKEALILTNLLKKEGINVLPIRTPTVPKNTARLRFSLNVNHSMKALEPIIKIIKSYENKVAE